MNPDHQALIDTLIKEVGRHWVVGLPLGLGKPNRLANALYACAREDDSITLEIVTALSLDPPQPGHWLEARLMGPILERQFGDDYPRLAWLDDLKADRLPANIKVSEFYLQSGSGLGKPAIQRRYISANYTHVSRDLLDRGVNIALQLVAGPEGGRYSLSCNPDVSLDLHRLAQQRGQRVFTVGQVHPDLPFMHGDAVVGPDFFDALIDTDPDQRLFALPRMPVAFQDHAVGLQASQLVADGGTLQIGIGSLSDALVNALIRRHEQPAAYGQLLDQLAEVPAELVHREPFEQGLYGASEMFMDAFMHLYQAGILKREVFDDLDQQRRANNGETLAEKGTGALMDGGFFLGTQGFYEFLRGLSEQERPRFRMHGVGRINQLYGGQEALEIAQRRHACFVNTCMMVTATGAAVSDGLANHQLVSGVGGQYNFVAMAHAMDDGRSILLLRSTRTSSDGLVSNIVWEYPHTTIPRHLRDIVVTEYGVAVLRGRTDEECIQALVGIMDARFQDELVAKAKRHGKLDRSWQIPDAARRNTPEHLKSVMAGQSSWFEDYPFGSDFDATERQLIPALKRLKAGSESKGWLLKALWQGRPEQLSEALARMGLDSPDSLKARFYARLLAAALSGV
ncbi:MAG: acetyl-CoA hydrolase/transferase C-terminal domain-containing protein [Wenzhouxiangella sp.]